MSRSKLSTPEKAKLRKASAADSEQYFVKLPAASKGAKWIASGNRYRAQCVKKFHADLGANPVAVDNSAMAKYVGASAPAHVIDGWSFLGRSVDAALRGDRPSTIFFAYYAELRAAMALLAAEGLGILSTKHPILAAGGAVNTLKGINTHDLAWLALKHWAGLKRSSKLLSGLVSPRNIPISTWLGELAPGVSVEALADEWLRLWGVDLKATGEDHDLRNHSSYRPSQFRLSESAPAPSVLKVVGEIWSLLEPGRGVRFPMLARVLLRRALRVSQATNITSEDLQQFIAMNDAEAAEWSGFLSGQGESLVVTMAATESKVDSAEGHLQVLCRASLLLAVATEASRKLLIAGGYDTEILRFWWVAHGIERGLWDAESVPDDPLDAWEDVREALEQTLPFHAGDNSLRELRANYSGPVGVLGGFEMAGIWGLVP